MKMMKRFAVLGSSFATLALLLAGPLQAAEEDGAGKVMPIKVSPYKDRPPENAESVAAGKEIYIRSCIFCHGSRGEGKGPVAYFLSRDTAPHPRDFTSGIYKFRSTASGELPLDEDLFRTVTFGVPGFMPSFVGLDPADRWKVIYYVKSLNPDFKEAQPEAVKVVGSPVPSTAVSVHNGYRVYQEFKCWECHGGGGQGDGKKAIDLKDDWGFLLPPRDLTARTSFKNGSRKEDLYRTIMAGLDGGAMPSYADFFEGEEEKVWDLINFILSLSSETTK